MKFYSLHVKTNGLQMYNYSFEIQIDKMMLQNFNVLQTSSPQFRHLPLAEHLIVLHFPFLERQDF